jgi:hypothetical protein
MSGDFARWAATETAAALTHDTPRPLVCASCRRPVERTLDDDWQHVTVDDGLACAAWPVRPARAEAEADR